MQRMDIVIVGLMRRRLERAQPGAAFLPTNPFEIDFKYHRQCGKIPREAMT